MSDLEIQLLRRHPDPSPEGQARLWRARCRSEESTLDAGDGRIISWEERTELLAYCGVEWAREMVEEDGFLPGGALHPVPLSALLSYLPRWGSVVPVLAAVAAGWVAHAKHECHPACPGGSACECRLAASALEAAERWLVERTEEAREAMWLACSLRRGGATNWIPCHCLHSAPLDWVCPGAEVAGEPAVRAAIRERLTTWVTSDG